MDSIDLVLTNISYIEFALATLAGGTRIIVASRWPFRLPFAAFISFLTSAGVRYSRVRSSRFVFLFRTVRFSVFGAWRGMAQISLCCGNADTRTVRLLIIIRTVYHTNLAQLPHSTACASIRRHRQKKPRNGNPQSNAELYPRQRFANQFLLPKQPDDHQANEHNKNQTAQLVMPPRPNPFAFL